MQIPAHPSRLFVATRHGRNDILFALPSLASTLTSLIVDVGGLNIEPPLSGQDPETYGSHSPPSTPSAPSRILSYLVVFSFLESHSLPVSPDSTHRDLHL